MLPFFFRALYNYLRTGSFSMSIMAETMEEKRRKIAKKLLKRPRTPAKGVANAQRKANKELTGYEGDEQELR
jgi:hypothetical protein